MLCPQTHLQETKCIHQADYERKKNFDVDERRKLAEQVRLKHEGTYVFPPENILHKGKTFFCKLGGPAVVGVGRNMGHRLL